MASTGSGDNKIQYGEMMSGNSGYKVIKIQLPSSIYDTWARKKKGEVLGKITLDKAIKNVDEQQEKERGTLSCSCTRAKCSLTLDPVRDNSLIVFNEDGEGYSLEGVVTHSCKAIVTNNPSITKNSARAGKGSFTAHVISGKEDENASAERKAEAARIAAESVRHKRGAAVEAHKEEPSKKVARPGLSKGDFAGKLHAILKDSEGLTLDEIKEKTGQGGRFKFKDVIDEYCDYNDGKYTLKPSFKNL